MKQFPKKNEVMFERALAALRNLAPEAKFKGKGLTEFSAQVERSRASRKRLADLDNQTTQEMMVRGAEDEKMRAMLEDIIDGVIGHEEFGKDSALYEALGYVRKSQRKSGLSRRRKSVEKPMP